MIPRLDPQRDARNLDEIAIAFLRRKGLEPQIYRDEQSARENVSQDLLRNRYPLLLTDLDTEGEKSCETFAGPDEEVVDWGMASILAVRYRAIPHALLNAFVRQVESFISSADVTVDKDTIVDAVSRVVPEFHHAKGSHRLDQRM